MGKAAELAIGPDRRFEIEAGEGMRLWRTRCDPALAQQLLAHQMRRAPDRFAHADVDAWLAELHRQELRMAIGKMYQVDVAEARHVVEFARRWRSQNARRS